MIELEFLWTLLISILFGTTLWIFISDLKDRTIPLMALVILFAVSVSIGISSNSTLIYFATDVAFKLIFLAVQVFVIAIYIAIRHGQFRTFFENYIGLGDVFFWLAVIPLFSFNQFALTFVASLIFSLALHGILGAFKFYKKTTVPLAGMQCLYFFVTLIIGL